MVATKLYEARQSQTHGIAGYHVSTARILLVALAKTRVHNSKLFDHTGAETTHIPKSAVSTPTTLYRLVR